jgi:hypothetical protein
MEVYLKTSRRLSTPTRRLMTPKTRSQRSGSSRLVSQIPKPPSLKIGMRMSHTRLSTRKPQSLTTGSMMSQTPFLTLRPRSQKTGMMKRMATGFLLRSPIPNAKTLLVAASGSHP